MACSDDDSTGTGGGAASSTNSSGSGSSPASSGSGSNQGGGGAGEGGGGAPAGTGGEGGGGAPAGTGGEGGGGAPAGTGGEGGGGTPAGTGGEGGGGAAAGTGGEGGSAPPSDPACGAATATFADVEPILTRSCANQYCHGSAGAPSGGLDLRASAAAGKLVNQDSASCSREQALVVPFKPSSSYLMNKLKDVSLCDPDESRMPPGAPLPEADIKKINDWICAGAPSR
ncbi:hypothetical protein WME79_29320 [Sorangium sp. So ce726]|uniref:hypothetical protein n=1 Tax=Sorangium sp. So ce726 TaxID=3133319 RepID=UPI003F631B37